MERNAMALTRKPSGISVLMLALAFAIPGIGQDDPARKLGAFVGKWQSEGTFANGTQVTSSLECRWTTQSDFLVCEQVIKMAAGEHHQLTIYSYNGKDQNYSYTTLEHDGKTAHVRTTNEFTTPHKESFRVQSSDDGGSTWKTQLEGTASKVAD